MVSKKALRCPRYSRGTRRCAAFLIAAFFCLRGGAEPIQVLHTEGTLHGFLELSDANGKRIGSGDLIEVSTGSLVKAQLIFHFNDGSIDDDRTVFSQRGSFQLIRDHHVQKGPSFPHPSDVLIDMRGQQVTTRTEKDGKPDVETKHLDLPTDLANGLALTLVKSIRPDTQQTKVAYLASSPKPRLVHLAISPAGEHAFSVGRSRYKALCYDIHIELGGVTGVVAPLIGKQPADIRIWVSTGTAPSFIREEGELYEGGPKWTIQLSSPVWQGAPHDESKDKSR